MAASGHVRVIAVVGLAALVATGPATATASAGSTDGAQAPQLTRAAAAPRAERDPSRILVKFKPDVLRVQQFALHRSFGASLENRLGPIGVDVVRVSSGATPEELVSRYASLPEVEYAQPNYIRRASAIPNDPGFPSQYGLNNTGQDGGTIDADVDAPEGWDLAGGAFGSAANYAVGIVDSGIDLNNADIGPKAITPCFEALSGNGTLSQGCQDVNDHGTHVSGIVGAIANNGIGTAGVAFDAKIYMCRALAAAPGEGAFGTDADIIACINEIVSKRNQHNIRVLNMSLGGPQGSPAAEDAADNAAANGILVVAAAGNNGTVETDFPAGFASVVSVGATTRNDASAGFTNVSHTVELSGPGEDVLSTVVGGTALLSGTSMASPHVAGIAALVSDRTGLTGSALRQRLRTSVDDLGPPGWDPIFGFGRVNLCRALEGANCGGNGPPVPETGNGTLGGTTRGFLGLPQDFVRVEFATFDQPSSALSFLFGSYSVTVPAGNYLVSAQFLIFGCRNANGFPFVLLHVGSGDTAGVDWFC